MQHKSFLYSFVSFCLFCFLQAAQLQAQALNPDLAKDTLIVGIAGNKPFIITTDKPHDPKGITIEIWENIANEMKWAYTYKYFASVSEALQALENGAVDLVAGPITITSCRVERMGFSQPYYQSSLSIVSRMDKPDLWEKISPFFSFRLLIAIVMLLLILAAVGMLLWLAERKESPEQFPSDPLKGIGSGMWLTIVTMSTTGYGDMAPVTLRGRIIAGTWMIVTLIFATSMVAGIASTLTLSSMGAKTVTNIEQLSNKKVATIQGSPAVAFLKEHNVTAVAVADLGEAFAKLKNHEVEAVVYDHPQLRYYLKNNEDQELYLSKAEYYKQGYGFAFPLKSSLLHDVNRSMLELAEDHDIARITDYYLGAQQYLK
jgi:polar amino acid transport system substrate-binding protein